MKAASSELKKRARLTLTGNYGITIGAMLIVNVILIAVMLVCVGTVMGNTVLLFRRGRFAGEETISSLITVLVIYLLIILLVSLSMYGIRRMLFNMSTGRPFALGDILFAFTHRPHRFLGMYFICAAFNLAVGIPYFVVSFVTNITGRMPVMVMLEILMYLFQIIGIIVFSLYFGMAGYLLVENPERKVISCFRECAALMAGNKGRLFYMGLSFAGMTLLGLGSFGIGFLWIFPYMEASFIHFYLDISAGRRREEAYYYEASAGGTGFHDGSYEDITC